MTLFSSILLSIIPLFAPFSWNAQDAVDDTPGYFRGDSTFIRTFHLSSVNRNDSAYTLAFDGVNQEAWVYLNGDSVGYHAGGYTRFSMDITPYVQEGDNTLRVRVSNAYNEAIPPLSADFTFFGGIYRKSYLQVSSDVHIAPDGITITTPEVTKKKATLKAEVTILNPNQKRFSLTQTLISPKGEKFKLRKGKLCLKNPSLWSPECPTLYTLQTQIKDRYGKVIETKETKVGFRFYHFNPNEGFFLNGEHLKLIGTNRHQDELGYGNALQPWQHERDIKMIKAMGANFLRVSHYPQDSRVMDLCDSLGILCSVEIPIINAISETEEFSRNCLTMLDEMIRQNRNHPSVIMWAYMNEVLLRPPYKSSTERDSIYKIHVRELAQRLDDRCHQLDKERYTMMAYHSNLNVNRSTGIMDIPQILGLNLYNGWYSGKMEGFEKNLDQVHQLFPDKIIMVSEYGADCDTRLRSAQPTRMDYTEDYALAFHQHYLPQILSRDFVAVAAVWNFNDFHSESRAGAIPHFNLKGLVTTHREPKMTYYYYQSVLSPNAKVRQAAQDSLTIKGVLPTANSHSYLLGTKRIFTDSSTGVVWQPIPEDYVQGGYAYTVKTRHGRLPAADADILGTDMDPIYQTAQIGLEKITIPLPNGLYDVTLHWAELQKNGEPVVSVYNLGNDALQEEFAGREMNVTIQGQTVLENLNLTEQYGTYQAHDETFLVEVENGQLIISLSANIGQTLLNSIQIFAHIKKK